MHKDSHRSSETTPNFRLWVDSLGEWHWRTFGTARIKADGRASHRHLAEITLKRFL